MDCSIVLDVSEGVRTLDGFPQSVAVLDVTAKVADSRVEDVVEGVLAEEKIADDTHATSVLVVHPQPAQVRNRVYRLLHLSHLANEILKWHSRKLAHTCHYFSILLDKCDDSLSVILGNIFRFVFKLSLINFLAFCFRLRRILIF
jgi:hypothetical protein